MPQSEEYMKGYQKGYQAASRRAHELQREIDRMRPLIPDDRAKFAMDYFLDTAETLVTSVMTICGLKKVQPDTETMAEAASAFEARTT